jgi:hypothetical protein
MLAIVPRLPPSIDGVGDYSLYLAQNLRQQFGLNTRFIVCDPACLSPSQIDGFPVSKLSHASSVELLDCLKEHSSESSQIFLHYVGYGYAKWGCPDWLLKALSIWCTQLPDTLLVTMFHELYAFPGRKPWKHQFWNSFVQKSLASKLARLSTHTVTSSQAYAKTIDTFRGDVNSSTPFFPVFSTVGEAKSLNTWADRLPQLVIFGQALNKRRAYEESWTALESICQQFGIQEIIDVGPKAGVSLSQVGSIPIREAGKCSIDEINRIFQNARLGFFNYNPSYLAKSTIFAAYCAYGLLPVTPFQTPQTIDGITPGTHYWVIDETRDDPIVIAANAQIWYNSHSLKAQTHHFAKLLYID